MSQTTEEGDLFEWLNDDRLEKLVIKLNALPSGDEFKRRTEEAIEATLGISESSRAYEEIHDAHGSLIGFVEGDESRLPWWLRDFDWTVSSENLSPITLREETLDEFEQFPRGSTYLQSIELSGEAPFSDALDAFVSLEGQLNSALEFSPAILEDKHGVDSSKYTLPDQIFALTGSRVETTDEFKDWFGRVLHLCPPADPSLTALLRSNVNIERKHVSEAVSNQNLRRLEELEVLQSAEKNERAFNEEYYQNIVQLLEIEAPFDLTIDIEHDKDELTPLQYFYYQSWAEDTSRRLAEEQRWLQAANRKEELTEADRFRFASYAFRMPLRLDRDHVVFTHQSKYGNSSTVRRQILDILAEYGHSVNND